MRGSGSTLYGSDAVGGVINIITAPPAGHRIPPAHRAGQLRHQSAARLRSACSARRLSEQLSFARDFSSGFRPTAIIATCSSLPSRASATDFGNGDLNLAYMDHPFGADQFYGNFNSWEDTKTWFAGVQQALGEQDHARPSASAATAICSCSTATARRSSPITTPTKAGRRSLRRREPVSMSTTLYYGVEALHESIVSNNLGDHARSRAARPTPPPISARSGASPSRSRAREEVYRSSPAEFSPTVAGGRLAFAVLEAARLRQPRLPRPQLHRPLLPRPRQPGQSRPASRARVDATKAAWIWSPGAARCAATSPSSSGASATASITSAPRPPTSGAR